jgi:hypothetical protein
MFVPMFGLSAFRSVSIPLFTFAEDVFFITLAELDPKLADQLKRKQPIRIGEWVILYAKRMLRLLGLSIVVFLWYYTPILGYLALPCAQYFYSSRLFGPKTGLVVSAISLGGELLGGQIHHWILLALNFVIASIELSRELLEPYFTRLPDYRRQPAILRQRYYRLMFGFSLPFTLLMSVPLLGVPLWGVAQAAAAALVVVIEKKEKKRATTTTTSPEVKHQ